jgi:hypothetical protein
MPSVSGGQPFEEIALKSSPTPIQKPVLPTRRPRRPAHSAPATRDRIATSNCSSDTNRHSDEGRWPLVNDVRIDGFSPRRRPSNRARTDSRCGSGVELRLEPGGVRCSSGAAQSRQEVHRPRPRRADTETRRASVASCARASLVEHRPVGTIVEDEVSRRHLVRRAVNNDPSGRNRKLRCPTAAG